MRPELSFVVVSRDTRGALARCLEAVVDEPGTEIWVVDNASSDGSADMVRRRYPSVNLIPNEENRGFAAACNQAVLRARGRVVVLLNPDAVPEPGALRRLCTVLEERPEVGVVGGQLIGEDGRALRSHGGTPAPAAFVAEMLGVGAVPGLRHLLPSVASPPRRHERARSVGYVGGACLAFRRELVDEIGLLDERFFLYFEETDFCVRVRKAGYLVWFEPAARIRHEGQASAGQMRAEAEEHYAHSAYRLVREHHGGAAALRLSIAFRLWLGAQAGVHRLQTLARRAGAQEALARKQRLRLLHRSLGRLRAGPPRPRGDSSVRPVRIGPGRGLRCEERGLLARPEMPAAAELDQWYRESYWTHDSAEQLGATRDSVQRHVVRALESLASNPDTLIDVGCGTGGLLALCRERGWGGIGFDPSLQAAADARRRGLEVHAVPWPCSTLSDETVGAVTFVNSLDHLREPFSALQEAWRVLRPGGLLYVRVPNGPVHTRLMTVLSPVGPARLPVFHFFGFGPRSLRQHLSRLGFRILVLRTAPTAPAAAYAGTPRLRRLRGRASTRLYRLLVASGLDRRALGASIEAIAVKDPRLARWAGAARGPASRRRELAAVEAGGARSRK